jgi:hypothetical protein
MFSAFSVPIAIASLAQTKEYVDLEDQAAVGTVWQNFYPTILLNLWSAITTSFSLFWRKEPFWKLEWDISVHSYLLVGDSDMDIKMDMDIYSTSLRYGHRHWHGHGQDVEIVHGHEMDMNMVVQHEHEPQNCFRISLYLILTHTKNISL